jgi:hypothetical protein
LNGGSAFTVRVQNILGRTQNYESGSRVGVIISPESIQVLKD